MPILPPHIEARFIKCKGFEPFSVKTLALFDCHMFLYPLQHNSFKVTEQPLIIKAGKVGTGINDKIWIGKAVVDASHLSEIAHRNGISEIAMSPVFYNNIIESLREENPQYDNWIRKYSKYGMTEFYHCSIIETGFDDWVKQNL